MKKILNILSTMVVLAVCITLLGNTDVLAATGPNTGKYCAAYIEAAIGNDIGMEFYGISEEMQAYYYGPLDFEGLDYDKKTNTLTMTNFKGDFIVANEMGDDFTIKLVGDNVLSQAVIWGYGYGGSVTFTGDGTLSLEKLWLQAEYSDSVLSVKGNAKVILDCQNYDHTLESPTFAIIDTYAEKAIDAKCSVEMMVENNPFPETEKADLFGYEENYIVTRKDGKKLYLLYEMDYDETVDDVVIIQYMIVNEKGEVIEYYKTEEEIYNAGYEFTEYDCFLYESAEQKITFTANASAPKKGDIITADGAKYKVTTVGTTEKKGAVAFEAPKEGEKTVKIPASIKVDGITFNVTSISASAFSGNKTVTSITIGKNVKTINKKAFYNCSKLKTLKISTTKLTESTVKADAFKNVNKSCKVTVPEGKASAYKKILQAAGLDKSVSVK